MKCLHLLLVSQTIIIILYYIWIIMMHERCAISILPNRYQLHICLYYEIGFSFSFLCGHLICLIHHYIAIDYQLSRLYTCMCMTTMIYYIYYTWYMQCNYVQRSHIDTHTYEMRTRGSFFQRTLFLFSLINQKMQKAKEQQHIV